MTAKPFEHSVQWRRCFVLEGAVITVIVGVVSVSGLALIFVSSLKKDRVLSTRAGRLAYYQLRNNRTHLILERSFWRSVDARTAEIALTLEPAQIEMRLMRFFAEGMQFK